jgi:hypothetical protein
MKETKLRIGEREACSDCGVAEGAVVTRRALAWRWIWMAGDAAREWLREELLWNHIGPAWNRLGRRLNPFRLIRPHGFQCPMCTESEESYFESTWMSPDD